MAGSSRGLTGRLEGKRIGALRRASRLTGSARCRQLERVSRSCRPRAHSSTWRFPITPRSMPQREDRAGILARRMGSVPTSRVEAGDKGLTIQDCWLRQLAPVARAESKARSRRSGGADMDEATSDHRRPGNLQADLRRARNSKARCHAVSDNNARPPHTQVKRPHVLLRAGDVRIERGKGPARSRPPPASSRTVPSGFSFLGRLGASSTAGNRAAYARDAPSPSATTVSYSGNVSGLKARLVKAFASPSCRSAFECATICRSS